MTDWVAAASQYAAAILACLPGITESRWTRPVSIRLQEGMNMPARTPVFDNLESAKEFAAAETAKNPRARSVYRLDYTGKDGQPAVKFLVAQSVPRAQNHAFGVLRDTFGVKLGVAERKTGGFQVKTPEELVRSLSPEEIDRVKAMLAQMQGTAVEEEPEKKGRRHK